jgi:opacity protein-like surface antigen
MARAFLFVTVIALACVAALAGPASAEWFLDAYMGAALTPKEDATLKGTLSGLTVDAQLHGVEFDTGISTGLRLGYWFPFLRVLGVAADLSYFKPDISSQTVTPTGTLSDPRGRLLDQPLTAGTPVSIDRDIFHVVAFAPELMLRWPLLVSSQFPTGRLQPYALAGPAVFVSYLGGFNVQTNVGAKAGACLSWQIVNGIAVFAEYQFTHFRPEFGFHHSGDQVDLKMNLDTHHALAGVSFRF